MLVGGRGCWGVCRGVGLRTLDKCRGLEPGQLVSRCDALHRTVSLSRVACSACGRLRKYRESTNWRLVEKVQTGGWSAVVLHVAFVSSTSGKVVPGFENGGRGFDSRGYKYLRLRRGRVIWSIASELRMVSVEHIPYIIYVELNVE